MSEESSDEIPVEIIKRDTFSEPDWDKLYISINSVLFKKFSGRPINFHFKIDDITLKRKYENLIISYGGHKVEDYIDIDNTTALMVENNRKDMLYERPSFKVSYIIDCITRNTLLDIGEYLHNKHSFKVGNFMNIIFWETDTFQNETVEPYIDSSDDSVKEIKTNKHSRSLYSRKEKESILKFILSNKRLSGLRGNSVWKKMEKNDVCPKRTYQSMKNHFLKTMLFELDKYEFLSESDKKQLKSS